MNLSKPKMGEGPTYLGEEHHSDREDNGGDHLETPGDSERSDAFDVGAAELDKVLDEDTPGDGPRRGE